MSHPMHPRKRFVLAVSLALAQSAWSGTTPVVLTGDFAPGTSIGVRYSTFGSTPQLNNAGQVSFTGRLSGAGIDATNDSGLWRDGNLAARTGNVAPGTGALVWFDTIGIHRLNAAGQVAFHATLRGLGVTVDNDQGLWRDGALVARTGAAAPGAGSGVSFSSLSTGDLQLNAAGQVAFRAVVAGQGVSDENKRGIWRDNSLIVRSGSAAPGTGNGVRFDVFGAPQLNAAGQVAYRALVAGAGVDGSNCCGIWSSNGLIAREGDAAPGVGANATHSFIATALRLNAVGQVVYAGAVAGPGIDSTNNEVLWRDRTVIAREGNAAPGTGPGVSFSGFLDDEGSRQINDAGQVSFWSFLAGAGVNGSNDAGLWRNGTLIVRNGDAAPGNAPGVRIVRLESKHQLNATGQVAFSAGLSGGGATSQNAYFLGDGVEVVEVVREGQALAGSTVASLFAVREGSFNDKGQWAYWSELADGRSGIFLFTPTLRWRSSGSGSWDDAAHWTLSLNPADVHDVSIDPANSLRVTGPAGAVRVKSLRVGMGDGLATLHMAGGRIDSAEPVLIGQRGVLSGTGSFVQRVDNLGTVQAERLVLAGGLTNSGLVRGVTGGPRQGAGLQTDLLNGPTGRVLVQPGETLQLRGGSHRNLGVFEVDQGRLEVGGSLLNDAGGVIDLNASTTVADGAWTNASGAGLLMGNARLSVRGGLNNAGQVQVTSGDSDVFGPLRNQQGGQIILSGQGTTTFYDAVEVQGGSELRVSRDASAVFFGAVTQRSGALMSGTGQKYYEGGLSIGNSPGLGEDGGDVSFGLGNVYLAEIAGTTPGSGHDQYRVAGTLSLGGLLRIVSLDGFTGQAGQSFDLFDWGQLSGQFSLIDSSGLQLAAGTRLDLSRLYVDGVVSIGVVPEPRTWALLLGGLAVLAWRSRARGGPAS